VVFRGHQLHTLRGGHARLAQFRSTLGIGTMLR
jgi:hypothetical protein